MSLNNLNLCDIRGKPQILNELDYVLDKSACGLRLIIEDNGKVVYAPNGLNEWQSVRAKMMFENKGIFEWDVIMEKDCSCAWVGVCSSEILFMTFEGDQSTGWVLLS